MTYENAVLPKSEGGKFLALTNRREFNVYKDYFQAHRTCGSYFSGLRSPSFSYSGFGGWP